MRLIGLDRHGLAPPLRGQRPFAAPLPESEAIVVSLDDYRQPDQVALPAVEQA